MSDSLKGIILHEGYNDLGTITTDINHVEQPISSEPERQETLVTESRANLFKFQFSPSGDPLPSDYVVKFDLPNLEGSTEIEDEIITTGGKHLFTFTLDKKPVKPGTLVVSDGNETFTDNGSGALYSNYGGSGTINYETGVSKANFYNAPEVGVDILANYTAAVSVTAENLGPATGAATYTFYLAHGNVLPNTFSIACDTLSLTDNGSGILTGTGGTGIINYETGMIRLAGVSSSLSGNFLANYFYWAAAPEEVYGTGALATFFPFVIVHHPLVPGSLTITDGVETFTDNGDGTLTGDEGGSGTIDYVTGQGDLTFDEAPAYDVAVTANYTTKNTIIETNPQAEGYIEIESPLYPVVKLNEEHEGIINYAVHGKMENREEEFYLRLDNGMGTGNIYTLITDIHVKDGLLNVFDGVSNYYNIFPLISIGENKTAIWINRNGEVKAFDSLYNQWTILGTLKFYSIEFPENLTILSDGFYQPNEGSGTATEGTLGDEETIFEDFYGIVNNAETFKINVSATVYQPASERALKVVDLPNITQGTLNFETINITASPYVKPDETPTLDDIETVSGISLSSTFRDFLEEKGLTTIEKIRKAGPITYIQDYPEGVGAEELKVVQGHVDLFTVNQDAAQNQRIIASNYSGIYSIANTPKDKFIEDVVNETLPLYRAAVIHENVVQSQKLVSNLLTNILSDARMEDPGIPDVEGSNFRSAALEKAVSSCGCSDCKSNISPFAYLMDLIKYAAQHVKKTPGYNPGGSPAALTTFINLLQATFLQPFKDLNVDCHTLHDEYCRVRLVTEVLEAYVIPLTPGPKKDALDKERNDFLVLVYKNILTLCGITINEVADFRAIADAEKKKIAAQRIADKLGTPLFVPSTTTYTADTIWLTIGGGGDHELNAVNLEALFGFRDTKRNVITNTPVGYVEEWREAQLRNKWKTEDYFFSAYSREGADPANTATIKANWKPIVDPDIIGWQDMTYLNPTDAKKMWLHRKEDTDAKLSYYKKDSNCADLLAIDYKAMVVRVKGKDLSNVEIEDDTIYLEDPVGPSWDAIDIIGTAVVGTNSDLIIDRDTAPVPMFNPGQPLVKYNRVLPVTTFADPTFNIIFTDPVFLDRSVITVAKLTSTGAPTQVFKTSDSTMSVSFIDDFEASITLNTTVSTGFDTGTISFIFEVEQELVSEQIINPEKICADVFANPITYDYLPTAILPQIIYYVWNDNWPSIITASTDYLKLKQIYDFISKGQNLTALTNFVKTDLWCDITSFNRIMNLFSSCEKYVASMFSVPKPSEEEQYEIASIIRKCGRNQIDLSWVLEELKYPTGSAGNLALDGKYFWHSVNDPKIGSWDPGLQTIPENVGDITENDIPLIDPELIQKSEILDIPETQAYRELYDSRQELLSENLATFLGLLIPHNNTAFYKLPNYIANDNVLIPYSIAPYSTFTEVRDDIESTNPFLRKKAADVVWNTFRFSPEDFLKMYAIKTRYESSESSDWPTDTELNFFAKSCVTAYKKKILYFEAIPGRPAWIEEEVDATGSTILASGDCPVFYYNIRKMNLAPQRAKETDRALWQKTLAEWNKTPIIAPDIIPLEYVKQISGSNWVFNTWNSRKTALNSAYNSLISILSTPTTKGALFTVLKKQIGNVLERSNSYATTPPSDYYLFFEKIKEREDLGEDIRSLVGMLGMTMPEYRSLMKIVDYASGTAGDALTWTESEIQDIANIIIAVNSRNLSFGKIRQEYDNNLLLCQDFFVNYKPGLPNFPISNLPIPNAWRYSKAEFKKWQDTLEARIDNEKATRDRWQEILQIVEDNNMPLMRDALIRYLTPPCVAWQDTAEKLARTFFIETKDNCCVKHTRVSFAIETLQGLLFALKNGIFDGFISQFSLHAPDFDVEWQWLGSYATWRSAMFVFIYPENLLYPSLKRKQTGHFAELNQTIQSATRITPDDACELAKRYEKYYNDVLNLKTICTTSVRSLYKDPSANSCCNEISIEKHETYVFAQAPDGTPYYAIKDQYDNKQLTFWEKLPIEGESVQILAGFVYGADEYPMSICLFFTHRDNGKLKMAYISKKIWESPSTWQEQKDCADLPFLDRLQQITAFQISTSWFDPCFVFSCKNDAPATYHLGTLIQPPPYIHYCVSYYIKADVFHTETCKIQNKSTKPETAILLYSGGSYPVGTFISFPKLDTNTSTIHIGNLWIEKTMTFSAPGTTAFPLINSFIGAFNNKVEPTAEVYLHFRTPQGTYKVYLIKISGESLKQFLIAPLPAAKSWPNNYTNGVQIVCYNVQADPQTFKIFPSCSEKDSPFLFAVKQSNSGEFAAKIISGWNVKLLCALYPSNSASVAIKSAECISDLIARKLNIEYMVKDNLNVPLGTAPMSNLKPDSFKDFFFEAYYFVPMLIALDQQKRGQYPSALNWYRTIYDYTNDVAANRKIFYGLVMEQTIQDSFAQQPNWLLDPLNPHLIAQTRRNAYTKYTVMNIIQCLYSWGDREFTADTIETVPVARKLYSAALDLLGIDELKLKANSCEQKATDCLDNMVPVLRTMPEWTNTMNRLEESLQKLGNASLIEEIGDEIAEILNEESEASYAERFAEAFTLIEENTPEPTEALDVLETIENSVEEINNAYRYVLANESQEDFFRKVENNYAKTVSALTQIPSELLPEPSSENMLDWLYTPAPSSNESMQFEFSNSSGLQYFLGTASFNPIKPKNYPFQVNTNYANVPFVIGQYQEGMPVSYTPILGYNFCMPQNPFYYSLELKGNLELFKIFNCRNIAGMVRELSPYAAATDSVTGMPVIGASGNLYTPAIGSYSPSQYRFRVLIERAKQMVGQAQQLESLFLAALEKEDAENYSQLRASQDLATARATVKLQDLRVTQANDEKVVADLQLGKATFIRDHYQNLYDSGLNAYETGSLILLQTAVLLQGLAAASQLTQAAVRFDMAFRFMAESFNSIAGALSTQSSVLSQLASFQRRQEEWAFQKNLANLDISIANQQIKVSMDNVRIVTQERQIAQMNTDHAQASLDFLKTKFTNAELYNFMGGVLERSYNYMLNLSTSIARTAERQLYFERQEQAGPFILDDYWQNPSSGIPGAGDKTTDRRGLTGSARLLVDITRLDQYAFDTNKRKLQMTKVISLAQNFPAEFQQFQRTGILPFSLTDRMFDYDFPGHYLRLINNVKTTVVGLVPVYDQIKATLTADTISYTVIGGTTFQKTPIRRLELDSVALTSANNASGIFEMQPMQNELLNPFEGMGLESRWEFKMPRFSNRMDYSNIADILISVDYTAFDSFMYRYQVVQEIGTDITFNRGFSFKNNFPDQWYELAEVQEGPPKFSVTISLKREMYPQGITDLQMGSTPVVLYFVRDENFTEEITISDFNFAGVDNNINAELIDGKYTTTNLGSSPVVDLMLSFDNTVENRELFSKEKVKDIFLLIPCKGELPQYPL